jgi:hypothetical protein
MTNETLCSFRLLFLASLPPDPGPSLAILWQDIVARKGAVYAARWHRQQKLHKIRLPTSLTLSQAIILRAFYRSLDDHRDQC